MSWGAPCGSSSLVVAQARDGRKSPATVTSGLLDKGVLHRGLGETTPPCVTDGEQDTDMAALLINWGRRLSFIGGIEGRWAPPVTRETQRLRQSKHVGSY